MPTNIRESHQAAAWEHVRGLARQYSQAKACGSYMENGEIIVIARGREPEYVSQFRSDLLKAADAAFLEDALLGATLLK